MKMYERNNTNYYEVMGLEPSASDDDIKKQYRKLALKYHPDRNTNPEEHIKMTGITEAYECLSDLGKRTIYDEFYDRNFARPSSSLPSSSQHAQASGSTKQALDEEKFLHDYQEKNPDAYPKSFFSKLRSLRKKKGVFQEDLKLDSIIDAVGKLPKKDRTEPQQIIKVFLAAQQHGFSLQRDTLRGIKGLDVPLHALREVAEIPKEKKPSRLLLGGITCDRHWCLNKHQRKVFWDRGVEAFPDLAQDALFNIYRQGYEEQPGLRSFLYPHPAYLIQCVNEHLGRPCIDIHQAESTKSNDDAHQLVFSSDRSAISTNVLQKSVHTIIDVYKKAMDEQMFGGEWEDYEQMRRCGYLSVDDFSKAGNFSQEGRPGRLDLDAQRKFLIFRWREAEENQFLQKCEDDCPKLFKAGLVRGIVKKLHDEERLMTDLQREDVQAWVSENGGNVENLRQIYQKAEKENAFGPCYAGINSAEDQQSYDKKDLELQWFVFGSVSNFKSADFQQSRPRSGGYSRERSPEEEPSAKRPRGGR